MSYVDKSIVFYLTQINKVPLLTREQEYDLAVRARKNDASAKQQLIAANLRFVVQTAKRYSNCGLPLLDLVSEGNLGLIRAVESFDPDKGYHFISYAVHWIKQSIIKAISEKSKIIRIPLNLNNSISHIEKSLRENHQGELTNESLVTISNEMQMSQKDILNLVKVTQSHASLDKQVNDENGPRNLKDTISDQIELTPEYSMVNKSLKEQLKLLIGELTEQEARIITLRFGLDNKKPKTLLEIGKIMSLTKERIRQIEKVALNKLQEPYFKNRLKEFLAA